MVAALIDIDDDMLYLPIEDKPITRRLYASKY